MAAQGDERAAGRWPLLPVAPLAVALIGVATALAIAVLGVRQLQRTSDEAAALHSKALAATLAARMRAVSVDDRSIVLARAARRSGTELLLVDQGGNVLVDQSMERISRERVKRLLNEAEGVADTGLGRVRFAASSISPPMEHLSVVAFVSAPSPAAGTISMGNAVAVLTLLLLGVAVAVALVFMRAAREDVTFVRQRIADMASGAGDRAVAGTLVPVRSLDQVGLLTAALNNLVMRFAQAERGYREDLKQAAQIDTERSQFLAGLSHELRTPLNAILGFTHLLESEAEGPLNDDAKESLAMIRTSGEHLKALIADILDLSAMETGQLRLTRSAVDVRGLAQEVLAESRATVGERPVTLEVSGERAFAWADPRRLRQVLTNLVANAIKATSEGFVRIEVQAVGDSFVQINVEDSGRGMDPDLLKTIFAAYKQAGDPAARRGGAGLGLAITRRLVLLHGGTIEASSEPGRGTRFVVRIPDETHAAMMPRDSLVPWGEAGDPGVSLRGTMGRRNS
jgi:signal transduction histidine kinase